MVGPEHDNRVLQEAVFIQRIQQSSHLSIHERDRCIVGLFALASLIDGDIFEMERPVLHVAPNRHRRNIFEVTFCSLRIGHVNLIKRVKVEVFLRSYIGTVRVKKTGGKEERLVLVLPDQFDNLRGNHAVCVFVIAAFRIPPGHTDAKVSVLFLASAVTSNLFLLRSIDADRIVPLIPCCRVVVAVSSNHTGIAVVINLSCASGVVPAVSKQLPQCDNCRVLLPQFMLQRMHVEGVRP